MTAISDAILNVTCQPKPPAREGCGSPEVIQVTRGAEGRDLVPATGALPSAQKFLFSLSLSLSLSVSQTDEIF